MQKKLYKSQHFIFILLIGLLLWVRGPQIYHFFSIEGKQSTYPEQIKNIHGKRLNQDKPHLLIFWATWCSPCKLELARIQNLIDQKKISPNQVYAIAIDHDGAEVIQKTKERNYSFEVLWDSDQRISQFYKIESTPSLIMIGKNKKIEWASGGISPLLELRLMNYF